MKKLNGTSWRSVAGALLCCALLCWPHGAATAEATRTGSADVAGKKALIDSFELIWGTLRERYWDSSMAGLNWQAIHDKYLHKIRTATKPEEARQLMNEMIERLPSSHLALIPAWAYETHTANDSRYPSRDPSTPEDEANEASGEGSTGLAVTVIDSAAVVEFVEKESPAENSGVHPGWIIDSVDGKNPKDLFRFITTTQRDEKAALVAEIVHGWLTGPVGSRVEVSFTRGDGTHASYDIPLREAAGKLVTFTNLPPEHVSIEHRKLANDVGYIRLNLFLDPVSVMPEMETAIHDFQQSPAIILDLRNNPGGLGVMAMGIAGWFVSREGLELGTMQGRSFGMKFEINPRLDAYTGRLAILVNGGSASTTEILAQGLQDLKRARIFGSRTAGAALPSDIIELPDGDRFQYPEANYVSVNGRVLEGNGVRPDVVVRPTIAALLEGRDLVLEAASQWSIEK